MTSRVPAPGEVWVFRHLAARGRGHVVIGEVVGMRVSFRYVGSGTDSEVGLGAFTTHYVFAAATLDELPDSEFPFRPAPAPGHYPPSLGTAVGPLQVVR